MFVRLFIVILFLTACSEVTKIEPVIQPLPTPKRELKKDIPNANWVKIYFDGFESRSANLDNPNEVRIRKHSGLDDFAIQNGFSILRDTVLPEGDLEVRVWVGFGVYGNDGLVLKRISGNWSAVIFRKMLCHDENRGGFDLEMPKSGWKATWQKLVDAEILTLPDSSKLKYKNGVNDGKSYVVETNSDYLYRTYNYSNPDSENLKETEQMMEIGQIIADEFGLESFSAKTGGCKENE